MSNLPARDEVDFRDFQRHILSSAACIEGGCCGIPMALAEYAGITDAFEVVRDDKGKYCICSEKNVGKIQNFGL